MLAALSDPQQRHVGVVARGGTLLRACWKRSYRYQEDLGLDWVGGTDPDREHVLEFFSDAARAAHLRFGTVLRARWATDGPCLEWKLPNGHEGILMVDVRSRDHGPVPPRTRAWQVLDRYWEAERPASLTGYTLDSVAAAKLDCLANPRRLAARDYYDLERLRRSGDVDPRAAIGEHIARSPHKPPADAAEALESLFADAFEHTRELTDDWERLVERKMLRPQPPTFDDLLARRLMPAVETALEAHFAAARPRRRLVAAATNEGTGRLVRQMDAGR